MPAVRAEIAAAGRRVVHIPAFDVHADESLRVAQVVTTLQRGGAERIALDLHRAFAHRRSFAADHFGPAHAGAIPHAAVN